MAAAATSNSDGIIDLCTPLTHVETPEIKTLREHAVSCFKTHNYPSALELYNKLIILDPYHPKMEDFRFKRGVCLFQVGNFAEACHDFQFILTISSRPFAAAFNLAGAMHRAGKNQDALKIINHSIAHQSPPPLFKEILILRSHIYLDLNEYALALCDLEFVRSYLLADDNETKKKELTEKIQNAFVAYSDAYPNEALKRELTLGATFEAKFRTTLNLFQIYVTDPPDRLKEKIYEQTINSLRSTLKLTKSDSIRRILIEFVREWHTSTSTEPATAAAFATTASGHKRNRHEISGASEADIEERRIYKAIKKIEIISRERQAALLDIDDFFAGPIQGHLSSEKILKTWLGAFFETREELAPYADLFDKICEKMLELKAEAMSKETTFTP